jgi:hypothetical protein
MVVPAGVSKGTGLFEALGDLGISRHNTVGIGDAENDHSLLEACELGVAVSNAVESLKAHADVVLKDPAGAGVLGFLKGPVLAGEIRVQSRRWRVDIGHFTDGSPATLPASRVNLLIAGGSSSGKSYLAGLIAERLVGLGYCTCIIDPEGDYEVLGRLRGMIAVRGGEGGVGPEQLVQLHQHRFGSVVVGLSGLPPEEKRSYYRDAIASLRRLRAEAGIPHWIFVDEADQLLVDEGLPAAEVGIPPQGFCLVTYRPEDLPPGVLHQIDVLLALQGAQTFAGTPFLERAAPLSDQAAPEGHWSTSATLAPGQGLMVQRNGARLFMLGERASPHVRHWRKYLEGHLPAHRRFYFRDRRGGTGTSAGSIGEFHDQLRRVRADVVGHHLAGGDFSRWIEDVIGDDQLAASVRSFEREHRTDPNRDPEPSRRGILEAVELRYGGEQGGGR